MNKEYKCVVVTPAGRQRYMELLLPYILKEKDFIDEYRIWVNTKNENDIQYFHSLKEKYPDLITLDFSADIDPKKGEGGWAIHHFFKNTIDENTIYIRLDDDIVWLEDNFIQNLYNFRKQNPQYFLVYGNIINNAIIDHLHQRFGCLETDFKIGYNCMDSIGWENPHVAELKHRAFLNSLQLGTIDTYKFKKWVLHHYERVSINGISWFGSEFAKFNGSVGLDEEQWLAVDKPKEIQKLNAICGSAMCSHFAFYTQRQHMDSTNILEEYKNLIKENN